MVEKKLVYKDDFEKEGIHLDRNYFFTSMDDFAEILKEAFSRETNATIDFTFADTERDVIDNGGASGWYGVTPVYHIFDGDYLCIGYYGGGELETIPYNCWGELKKEDILEKLIALADSLGYWNSPKDFPIAIDAETLNDIGMEDLLCLNI